jgi:hypothetical protein
MSNENKSNAAIPTVAASGDKPQTSGLSLEQVTKLWEESEEELKRERTLNPLHFLTDFQIDVLAKSIKPEQIIKSREYVPENVDALTGYTVLHLADKADKLYHALKRDAYVLTILRSLGSLSASNPTAAHKATETILAVRREIEDGTKSELVRLKHRQDVCKRVHSELVAGRTRMTEENEGCFLTFLELMGVAIDALN